MGDDMISTQNDTRTDVIVDHAPVPTVSPKQEARAHPLRLPLAGGAVAAVSVTALWWAAAAPNSSAALAARGFPGLTDALGGFLNFYLPVADVSVNLVALVGLGFAVGCLSGLFGVGGGFLMTPLLMMFGIPAAQAAASSNCQMVGASSSGAIAHTRMGNVDVKLGLTLLLGGLVGGTAGVQIVTLLRTLGNFESWVKIVYVIVLGLVGSLMLGESTTALVKNWVYSIRRQTLIELVREGYTELQARLAPPEEPDYRPFQSLMARLPLQTTFHAAGMKASYIAPFALGLLVGVLTAIMGVGGGFIMLPALTYIFGVKTKLAVGTSLFQMVFTSINVTFLQAVSNGTVDITLALLLLVGSAVGAQVGAKLGRPLKGHQLRILLGLLVLAVTVKLILDLTLAPGTCIVLAELSGGE